MLALYDIVKLKIRSVITGDLIRTVEAHQQVVTGISWHPMEGGGLSLNKHMTMNAESVFMSSSMDGNIHCFNWETRESLYTLQVQDSVAGVNAVAFSPDHKWFVSAH